MDGTVLVGDNLDIMRGMDSASIGLIYLDPPFNSRKHHSAPVGSKAVGSEFKDIWTYTDADRLWVSRQKHDNPPLYHVIKATWFTHGYGTAAYLCMMGVRLVEMRRILKPTGSIYLHCDHTASHYLKLLMDAVFGKNLRNEIVWCYTGPGSPGMKQFQSQARHDLLVFQI